MQIYSGQFKSRKIISPKGSVTRPTSGRLRESLFNICQGEIEGASFLDLFAGSGAMGLEAISRGAAEATFVDNSKEGVRCIKANINALGVDKSCRVIYGDVFTVIKELSQAGKAFDLIYADPPYGTIVSAGGKKLAYSEKVVEMLGELVRSGQSLLRPGGSLFIEDASGVLLKEQDREAGPLLLKGTRKMGRSALQHWVYR